MCVQVVVNHFLLNAEQVNMHVSVQCVIKFHLAVLFVLYCIFFYTAKVLIKIFKKIIKYIKTVFMILFLLVGLYQLWFLYKSFTNTKIIMKNLYELNKNF